MEKDKVIKVVNRSTGRVGYTIPELNVRRQFAVRESKDLTFGELQALSFIPGGMPILQNYLLVTDEEAAKELGIDIQPEYYYDDKAITKLLTTGSENELLDCLDFAPEGVIEMLKKIAVSLPLNDMGKRKIILDKLNFDVTRAIEIQNSDFDGADPVSGQRKSGPNEHETPARRTAPPKYNVVK